VKVGSLVRYAGSIPNYEGEPFTGLVLYVCPDNGEALVLWKVGKTWSQIEYLEVLSESR
jgi:hypothetical protein